MAPGVQERAFGAETGAPGAVQSSGLAVTARPIPEPVVPPAFFQEAVSRGTRSPDGRPGSRYWQVWTTYEIDARLDPDAGLVEGTERVRFENRSPDTIPALGMNLYQNIHQPGAVRNEPQEITGGVELGRVRVDGVVLQEGRAGERGTYEVDGTILVLRPVQSVLPGETVRMEIEWSFTVPQSGAGRMGWSERDLYFVAYWFPKMAVYDDLRGWDVEPYLGNGEFYDGFGDYRVSIEVPGGWTVMATGGLENPEEVYTERTLERLDAASTADSVVIVAGGTERAEGLVTAPPAGPDGRLVYRFAADSVRDFTWTASADQWWYATSAHVPGRAGATGGGTRGGAAGGAIDATGSGARDRVLIHSFWRPGRAPLWEQQAPYGKHSVEHHSRYTGLPYPWPHMTSVEGADIIGGGMEFPMLTVMGPYTGQPPGNLYNVTSHEIAHMWIPMIVGTNERRYAWMDEGSTSFLENQGRPDFRPGDDAHGQERENYLAVARAGLELPLMRHADYYGPGPAYGAAAYAKPATLLVALRALLGDEVFLEGYRSFIEDWAYRHPTPWDFFNTFERVAARDLDWFWSTWYYETWTLDHAVTDVEPRTGGGAAVVVEDRGWAFMPARLRIETRDGEVLEREIPVEHWLRGATRAEVEVPVPPAAIERVQVDAERQFPDVDRTNDVWTPDGA